MGVTRTVCSILLRGVSHRFNIYLCTRHIYIAATACTGDCKILSFIYPRRAHNTYREQKHQPSQQQASKLLFLLDQTSVRFNFCSRPVCLRSFCVELMLGLLSGNLYTHFFLPKRDSVPAAEKRCYILKV